MKIGFIGLGIMGESMCENIVKKHDDTVYCFDFIPAKVELLASKGAVPCKDSVELAEKSDVIISMVPKSEHSMSVYKTILPVLGAGKTCIDMSTIENGGQMTTAAFAQIPYIGPLILMVSIITFAYSTILGWSYYGERAAEYLLGKKAILPYKVLFIAVVVCAPVLALDLVWTIADVLNAFMAIPNLIAVLLLSGVIAAETKHYLKHLDEKDESEIPVVDR